MLVRSIERAGFRLAIRSGSRWISRASEFGRDGRYKLALEDRELDRRGMIALLSAGFRVIRSCRSRIRWPRTIQRSSRSLPVCMAGRCKNVGDDFLVSDAMRVRDASAAAGGQYRAAEAEPARHVDRNTGRLERPRKTLAFPADRLGPSGTRIRRSCILPRSGGPLANSKVGSFARRTGWRSWHPRDVCGSRTALAAPPAPSTRVGSVLGTFRGQEGVLSCVTPVPIWRHGLSSLPGLEVAIAGGRCHAADLAAAGVRGTWSVDSFVHRR